MSASGEAVPGGTIRLLLVEDDPNDARLLSAFLAASSSPHFDLFHVTTIHDACVRISEDSYDLIILDLGLPDASELEGLTRLQACAELPVIVLTGRADENLAFDALHQGAEDYLVKGTVDRNVLIRAIRYAVERHRGVRELAQATKELQMANATLERLTLLDPLTNVLNRRGLQQALSREIENVRFSNREVLVLLIDIDDFKRVNDTLGHAIGDVALQEIARKLRGSIRGGDYVARIGSDEFILLLPHADPMEAVRVAERARVAIATTTIQHQSGTMQFTASVGVMRLAADTPSIDELLSRGHELLQRSKRDGKNRVSYERGQFDDTEGRAKAQSDMCTRLSEGRHLQTVKQPIFKLADGQAVGYEFLSRYSNGTFEMPEYFFRLCSERNILTLVDHHCLRGAVNAASTLPAGIRFHVNLFPSTMISIPVQHLLETFPSPLPPRTFCIEVSEQQIIGDPSYLIEPVNALRRAGLLIAIDDVGFGHSCLESLVILEPDVIKIDKRCVVGLAGDTTRIRHLQRYLTLARTLGAEIVAEGIETPEELQIVRDLGVEFGQGYLWGIPD